MGHIVSHESVKVDPNKIKYMMEWTIPKTLNNIRGFLGLTEYYHKIVKKYGRIAAPLTTLLKKVAFSWTQKATPTFEKLKRTIYRACVLATPDFTSLFIVEYDASRNGTSIVLMQEGNPLVFESCQIKGKTYSNPFMRRKCLQYYMQLINGILT